MVCVFFCAGRGEGLGDGDGFVEMGVFGWLRQKFKPKGRGAACLEKNGFRVRFCISSEVVKIAPLNVLKKPVFIGRMLLGFSTWSLNFFLFCKF